jgi:hypothetical protein
MKGVRAAALTLLALAIAAWVALVARIGDGESVRAAIGSALEAALGEPVALGGIETALFPLPALRIRDLRIGTRAGIRVEAPELRVGVSPWGLLLGRVVLRSIELESPELFWPHPGGEAHDPRAERPRGPDGSRPGRCRRAYSWRRAGGEGRKTERGPAARGANSPAGRSAPRAQWASISPRGVGARGDRRGAPSLCDVRVRSPPGLGA